MYVSTRESTGPMNRVMHCLLQFSSLCITLEQWSNLTPDQSNNMCTLLGIWTHGGWDPMLKSTPSKGLVDKRHVKLHWQFDIRDCTQHIERAVDAVRNQGLIDRQAAEQYNIACLSEWVYQNTSLHEEESKLEDVLVWWLCFGGICTVLLSAVNSTHARDHLSMWLMAAGILSSVATQSSHLAQQLQCYVDWWQMTPRI